MLTHRIGNAFSLYLAAASVNAVLFLRRGVQVYIVQLRIDTSKNGVVICTAPLLNHADTSTYGKHISGIINISTQSDSNNIDTVQIYVAYAHTTVKATFDWEVSLDFDKIGMSISFIPQPRTTIIAEGHATFWYNSQDFEVAPNV